MEESGIDAFLVPHADRFQSEYAAPRDERLKWLTGFTGSAGSAVVTHGKAALFVDGRYTLQAPKEVDTKVFEIYEVPHARASQWLEKRLDAGDTVAADPWLLTVAQAKQWENIAAERGWLLKWVDANPIDALWEDRPREKIVKAEAHALKYAGKSHSDKIAALTRKMASGAERVLVADPLLVCWLLNLRGRDVAHVPVLHAMALVEKSGAVTLFTNPAKISPGLRKALGGMTVRPLEDMLKILGARQSPIQIDPNTTPKAVEDMARRQSIVLIEADDPCILMRACKNASEIKGAVAAHEKDARAFAKFRKWFDKQDFAKKKIMESDIVAALHKARAADKDFIEESFDTIAGFAANGAIVHYRVTDKTDKRLKPGNLLLLDSGGQYRYGTTDVTRVLPVGRPSPAMKKHYTAVLKGLIALSTARFPAGTTGAQLDALARAPIWEAGLDYAHGTGHGVGSFLSVHEGPQGLSPRSNAVLHEGMILSVEPGIYLAGKYGIRLENLVVVVRDTRKTDKKEMLAFKTLTKIPFEKSLIVVSELTKAEKKFLRGFGLKF